MPSIGKRSRNRRPRLQPSSSIFVLDSSYEQSSLSHATWDCMSRIYTAKLLELVQIQSAAVRVTSPPYAASKAWTCIGCVEEHTAVLLNANLRLQGSKSLKSKIFRLQEFCCVLLVQWHWHSCRWQSNSFVTCERSNFLQSAYLRSREKTNAFPPTYSKAE